MTDIDLSLASGAPTGRHPGPAPRPSPRRGIGGWTRSALRDVAYSGAVLGWSIAAFSMMVSGLAVTVSSLFLVVGVVVWVGFAYAMRWTTWVDRRLAGWRRGQTVAAVYRRPTSAGFGSLVKTLTTDPQTWRDLGWMALTSVLGFTSGLAVITAIGVTVTYVTMPSWYWAVDDPSVQYGITNVGLFTVHTLGQAAVMSVVGVLFIPLVLLLARGCASMHAALAVRLLSRPSPVPPALEEQGRHA